MGTWKECGSQRNEVLASVFFNLSVPMCHRLPAGTHCNLLHCFYLKSFLSAADFCLLMALPKDTIYTMTVHNVFLILLLNRGRTEVQ